MSTVGSSQTRPRPYVVAIIQARMTATRFPNKVMADICGKPMLWHVIERVKRSTLVHDIVVASPDIEIIDFANANKCWGFYCPQDPENVLARYIKAANWAGAELVVRITADCPLICPEIIDNTIKGYLENKVDLSTTVLRRTFMKGLDVEVTHINVLKRIFHLTRDARYLEHVTLFCYEQPSLFRIHNISDSNDYSFINVSVDTEKDLDNIIKFVNSCNSMNYEYKDIKDFYVGR